MEFFSEIDLLGSSPILSLSVFSLIGILVNAFLKNSQRVIYAIGVLGVVVSMAFAVYIFPLNQTAFSDDARGRLCKFVSIIIFVNCAYFYEHCSSIS